MVLSPASGESEIDSLWHNQAYGIVTSDKQIPYRRKPFDSSTVCIIDIGDLKPATDVSFRCDLTCLSTSYKYVCCISQETPIR